MDFQKTFDECVVEGVPFPSTKILNGDCVELLKSIPDESIDSVVTDPPYEIALANLKWDNTGVAFNEALWKEIFRVLKPGSHIICFGATRTIHRTTTAIEAAGFEIRDMIQWLYYSAMPHGLDISKAIERMMTNEDVAADFEPTTDEAKAWFGWNTQLKPSHEPAVLARKPIAKSNIAEQVLATGTGGLNIDACRMAIGDDCYPKNDELVRMEPFENTYADLDRPFQPFTSTHVVPRYHDGGRWPANIFHSKKPSIREKNQGLEHLEPKRCSSYRPEHWSTDDPVSQRLVNKDPKPNHHATVKPLKLMKWLVRLVTPPNGTVLDPFGGSGTTGAAATLEGLNSILCELNNEYIPIIEGRVMWARNQRWMDNIQLTIPW